MHSDHVIVSRSWLLLILNPDSNSGIKLSNLRINFDFLGAELSLSQFLMKQGVGISSSGLITRNVHMLQGARSIILEISNQANSHFLLQLDC